MSVDVYVSLIYAGNMKPTVDETNDIIRQRIRVLRAEKRLSQEKLAEQCGIDRSHIGYIEQGRRCPTIATLRKITNALDTTLEKLFADL